mmetsp:Transcript_120774/g.352760  ORF Transcript_120774/g.352760 Transcript_120774/m.352760 type:complete len:642 (+) Transcript_120774:61-1986(+)
MLWTRDQKSTSVLKLQQVPVPSARRRWLASCLRSTRLLCREKLLVRTLDRCHCLAPRGVVLLQLVVLLKHEPQQLLLALAQRIVGVLDVAALVVLHVIDLLKPYELSLVALRCGTLPLDVLLGNLQVEDGGQAFVSHEPPEDLPEERRAGKDLVPPRRSPNGWPILGTGGRRLQLSLCAGCQGDEVGLLHGPQRHLIPPEDRPQEDVVGHAFLSRAGQELHSTPELRPAPLCTRLAKCEQCPHVGLCCLHEPPYSILHGVAFVHVCHDCRDVSEAATNRRDVSSGEVRRLAALSLEVLLDNPWQGPHVRVAELMDCEAFRPVPQCRQDRRLCKRGVRDEEHACQPLLADVGRPCHKGLKEAITPVLVLGGEAVDDDDGHGALDARLVALQLPPGIQGLRDAGEHPLNGHDDLVLAAELPRAGQKQVEEGRHHAVHTLRRPVAHGAAEPAEEDLVVHRAPRLQHLAGVDVQGAAAQDLAHEGALPVPAVPRQELDLVLRLREPLIQLIHLLVPILPEVAKEPSTSITMAQRWDQREQLRLCTIPASQAPQHPSPRSVQVWGLPAAAVGTAGSIGVLMQLTSCNLQLHRDRAQGVPDEVSGAEHAGHNQRDHEARIVLDEVPNPLLHERLEVDAHPRPGALVS